MSDLLIGKIVLSIAMGAPTAWFIGRIFYDVFRHKIARHAYDAGYIRAIADMRELDLFREEGQE